MKPNIEKARAIMAASRLANSNFIPLRIEGPVDEVMLAKVRAQLGAAPKAGTIYATIDSPGGDLRSGRLIYDAIRRHGARRKLAYGFGEVASAAALIFAAADVRRVAPDTRILLHAVSLEPVSANRWTRAQYESHAATLAALDEGVAKSLAERCGAPLAVIEAELSNEQQMPLPKALSIGLVHEIVGVSPPLLKTWPAVARDALATATRFTNGADAHRYRPGFLAACNIGGK